MNHANEGKGAPKNTGVLIKDFYNGDVQKAMLSEMLIVMKVLGVEDPLHCSHEIARVMQERIAVQNRFIDYVNKTSQVAEGGGVYNVSGKAIGEVLDYLGNHSDLTSEKNLTALQMVKILGGDLTLAEIKDDKDNPAHTPDDSGATSESSDFS